MDPYTTPASRDTWRYPPRKHTDDLSRAVRIVRAVALVALLAVAITTVARAALVGAIKARADVQAPYTTGY